MLVAREIAGFRARSAAGAGSGGVVLTAIIIPGVVEVKFACSLGTVDPSGGNPGVITDIDPADTITSTNVLNQGPTADAGADQTVDSEQTGVSLDGSGSSDPESDPLTYSWTQTAGPTVALTGAGTASPSFDAPVGPATLTFELEVCDEEPLCDTDEVEVTVKSADVLRGGKIQIRADLDALLPTGKTSDDKAINEAIKYISKSLNNKYWVDNSHLEPKKGQAVFDAEKKAVKYLAKVKETDVSAEIDALVGIDRRLAETAIEEIPPIAVTPKYQEDVDEETAKAIEELAKGKFDKAIEKYKKAWERAQKATGYANRT